MAAEGCKEFWTGARTEFIPSRTVCDHHIMCGIAGIFRGADTAGRKLRVERVTEALIHRGPDDVGFFDDEIATFGFRQLAVIDFESIVDGLDAPLGDPTTIPTRYITSCAGAGDGRVVRRRG